MVDCFRKADDIGPLADDAIAIGAKTLWMQLGCRQRGSCRESASRRTRCRDGPLRQDRARATVRWPELGRRQHPRDLCASPSAVAVLGMADRAFGIETLCLHAGQLPDAVTGSRAQPIYQTTSYVFDSADHAASLFNLQTFGNVYSRISNPTVAVFEERVAALENGRAALATSSGMAAQLTAILAIVQPGDHIVASSLLYGGTYSQFAVTLPKMGIESTLVDPDDPENFQRALKPNTRLVYAETLGNPKINVLDIERVAAIAHGAQIPLMIDNTMASPYLCRPFDWGADIVVHSATKYIGGHGTTIGGVLVESGKFDWGNGKFPDMVAPSKGYHGVKFWETFGDFAYTMKARMEVLRVHGSALAPLSAWLLLQGLETLHVEWNGMCKTRGELRSFFEAHPRVEWVNWPGLEVEPVLHARQKISAHRSTVSPAHRA